MPYVANTDENRKQMLGRIGKGSFEELLKDIPPDLRLKGALKLPNALSELEVTNLLKELSRQNYSSDEYINFLGAGSYDHFIRPQLTRLSPDLNSTPLTPLTRPKPPRGPCSRFMNFSP